MSSDRQSILPQEIYKWEIIVKRFSNLQNFSGVKSVGVGKIKFLNNFKIATIYRSGGTRISCEIFRESGAKMCFSIPRINFRCRYISLSGHLVDTAMKARSRWCFLPPSVSVDCQYLGKTARRQETGGIERAGFLVPIRVSAHLLTRFDDRNLSRYKTDDWRENDVQPDAESLGFIERS